MTLADLSTIAGLISSVAVLVSLIYLAIQVRQAERNQQASIRQGRATRAVDIILASAEPALVAAMPKGAAGDAAITALEFGQFAAIYGAFLASAEDTWLQHQEDLLTDAMFASFTASWRTTLAQPGVRALWKLRRGGFEAGFAAFMDKLIADVPTTAPSDFFESWKAELAKEKR
jgi:hypothetical protein